MVKAKILRKAQTEILGYIGLLILIVGIIGTLANIVMALQKGKPDEIIKALPKAHVSVEVGSVAGMPVALSA